MSALHDDLTLRAKAALAACEKAGLRLATAESCTGGLISACLTEIPGSSRVFERGFVTYSNQAKSELLGVPASLIQTFGAVSEEVARAMADGALAHSDANVSIAVTGIAGPDGGTEDKPVGLVHLAAARKGASALHRLAIFPGDRSAVRAAAVNAALDMVERMAVLKPGREP